MIYSMTGFASKTISIAKSNNEKTNITITIKSLNSRFFDITCKIHYAFLSLEHKIISLARERLYRGHIYCTIHVSNPTVFTNSVEPSVGIIQSYIQAMEQIKKIAHIQDQIKLEHLLSLSNIFSEEACHINESVVKQTLDSIADLIEQVHSMRAQEGALLLLDFQQRIQDITTGITHITERSKLVIERHKQKIVAMIKETSQQESPQPPGATSSSLYITLEKMDITEELVRFKSHLNGLLNCFSGANIEKGKRIDFTIQELAREINTISAKCIDAEISEHAINVKVEIEKMREQVQNIV